ncbi:hypothetical protein TNCV_259541 [Trichonephila clavipes]|uniref:Uncharacterized protein n=1 Tax=Trichonephila clavipes TaxID=2585209 RepID=A0A8X6V9L3_TRICX|nr:hypothetical protein TNCV_259541 [Trichonephila clavipes]
MNNEVRLQLSLLYHSLAVGEDSLSDSELVLAGNRSVSDFRLTICKRSNDSHLRDEQQLLYLTLVYQPLRSRCFQRPSGCSRLRSTTGVHLYHCHDEFRGPRSDYVRQVACATATTQQQDAFFQAWTAYSSLSTSIMSGDKE